MATMAQIASWFDDALKVVWGDRAAAKLNVTVTDVPPKAISVLASIAYHKPPGGVFAIDQKLLTAASSYMLKVAPELLNKPDDFVKKILLHEAIHVGYPLHDWRFERVAKAVGTGISEHAIESGGTHVIERQEKPGGRFRPVFESADRDEAERFAWGKKAGPGRYRMLS